MSDELERTLATWLGGRSAVTFGRASAGLYALFRALAERGPGGEVLIPELCCETIPPAATYAGLRPVLVDVDPATLGPSLADVQAKLTAQTRAVLLIYLFGIPFDVEPFLALGAARGVLMIEDVAQAVGGAHGGHLLGSRADAAVLSFDDRKVLRGAGGAVVVRDDAELAGELAAVRAEVEARPRPPELAALKLSYRNLVHALADLLRNDPDADVAGVYRTLLPRYEPVVALSRDGDGLAAVADQLPGLAAERKARFRRYERYRAGLAGSGWAVPEYPDGAMCWRVPVIAPDASAALAATSRLRAAGLPASNHYFPFGPFVHGASRPVAGDLGRRLLNLWVDDTVDDDDVDRAVALVRAA